MIDCLTQIFKEQIMNEQIACDFKGEIVVPAGFQFNGGCVGIKKKRVKRISVLRSQMSLVLLLLYLRKTSFAANAFLSGKKR